MLLKKLLTIFEYSLDLFLPALFIVTLIFLPYIIEQIFIRNKRNKEE